MRRWVVGLCAGRDCVAPCDGVPQLSAASGRDCDASRAGGLRSIADSGRDCVASGEGELQLSAASGDAQLRLSAASGRGCFALRDGGLSGSACSGAHCVAPGDGELRVSASPGSECDALCDAVVAAQAGSRNRKSVVSSSDCDFDSSAGCARMNSCWDTHAARVNSQGLHSARGNSGDILIRTGVRTIHAVELGEEQNRRVRVLGARLGVLLWRILLLCSRRQEGCMSRRGQDAMGT